MYKQPGFLLKLRLGAVMPDRVFDQQVSNVARRNVILREAAESNLDENEIRAVTGNYGSMPAAVHKKAGVISLYVKSTRGWVDISNCSYLELAHLVHTTVPQ